jgi:hypothetical protein
VLVQASLGLIAGCGRVARVTDDSSAADGVATDSNDWRVTVRLRQSGQAGHAAARLSAHRVEHQVHARLGGRVMVGTEGRDELYLYTHSQDAATAARQAVANVLSGDGMDADYVIERWHPVEEEWQPADVSMPRTPAEIEAERARLDADETRESLASGHALFEVRVQLPSHREAVTLAATLHSQGYSVVRRWRFLVVGANNADQAEEFAATIRQEVPDGAVVSTEEVGALLPFTAIDAAAETGL